MNTCATCQWMQPYATGKPDEGGECMFAPPIVDVVRDSVITLRPSVLATDWCSEWDDGSAHAALSRHAHAVVFDGAPVFAVHGDDGWTDIKKES